MSFFFFRLPFRVLGPEGTPLPGIGVPGVPPYRHKHPPRALLRGVPVWIFIPSALGLLLVQPERDLGAPSLRGPLLSTKVSVRRAAAPLQGHPRVLGVGAEPSLVGEEVVGSDRGGVRLVSLLALCKTSKNLALRGGWQLLPLPPGRRSRGGSSGRALGCWLAACGRAWVKKERKSGCVCSTTWGLSPWETPQAPCCHHPTLQDTPGSPSAPRPLASEAAQSPQHLPCLGRGWGWTR